MSKFGIVEKDLGQFHTAQLQCVEDGNRRVVVGAHGSTRELAKRALRRILAELRAALDAEEQEADHAD